MKRFLFGLTASLTFVLACENGISLSGLGGLAGAGAGGTSVGDEYDGSDDNGADDDTTDDDSAGDDSNDDDGMETTVDFGFSGKLAVTESAKRRPRASDQTVSEGFSVVAASNQTGEVYEATTDADGNFSLEVPKDEAGSTFIVTIVNPDGQAEGPILLGETSEGKGITGLALAKATSLGTIDLPDDTTVEGILAGQDGNVGDQVDLNAIARLDGNGVPVGVPSVGKGEGADGPAASGGGGGAGKLDMDSDQDGLIDLFDADNDGNGIVDDFEGAIDLGAIPVPGVRVNFFMNLKIDDSKAAIYANGTLADIDAALEGDTVITFEVMTEPGFTKEISAVHLATSPSPAYLYDLTVMHDTGSGIVATPWADLDFAFDFAGDRWQAFAIPNALLQAGDTFAVLVDFTDGTSMKSRRMINYVFKNIPQLINHGTTAALAAYAGGVVTFDGTQDLVLEFQPPVDETGAFLTGFDYFFEFFYNDASHAQVQDIDWNATFGGTPPAGFQNGKFVVTDDQLGALSASNTYTVTLPAALFVNSVTKNDTSTVAIDSYKIDIAAQNSGNAAIMIGFDKQ